MNILITGGAGFIGSSLSKSLLEDGHNISIIDNLRTGRFDNIKGIINDITFLNYDLSIPHEHVDRLLSHIDVVYHFAASIGVKLIQEDPWGSLNNSMNINNTLFPLFEKHQNKVVFSSTSEVYGETKHPNGSVETDKLEIYPTHKPRGSYACSKLISEFMLKSYTFPNTIVRFFNIVGPTQIPDHGHVLPRFVDFILNNKNLTIYGDGNQLRSYCDIRDAVNMLKLMMKSEHDDGIYNIGNDENVCTVNELANRVKSVFDVDVGVEHITFEDALGPQFEEIYIRFPDTSKMKRYYKCLYSLDDIIKSVFVEVNYENIKST